ncbi:hypothetical protein LJC63_02545 [Ruminococcaceae bacterium OttesenSCG-928-L11]|nr:hypothetical protein [Ruminococcaceae bacterium OttesenSCG-928-L11]
MELLLNIVIRWFMYVMILFPFTRGIFSFAGNVLSWILAFLLSAFVISILEIRGQTKKIVQFFAKLLGAKLKSSDGAVSNVLAQAIDPDEIYKECPNCGSQVLLSNGKGKCDSCDTFVTQE